MKSLLLESAHVSPLPAADYSARLLQTIREKTAQGELKRIYTERKNHGGTEDYLREVAEVKRFLERWVADDEFRVRVAADPSGAARDIGLSIDPAEIRSFWDSTFFLRPGDGDTFSRAELRYRTFLLEKIQFRNLIRTESAPAEPRFRAWRARQMARLASQLPPRSTDSIVHTSFAAELSDGCSVGCWFCGIAARRLKAIFHRTEENAELWRGVLRVLREIHGEGARYGFCYWATEPLDNPDYEKFILDFQDILGALPQTTTALAARNPARIRDLLELARQRSGKLERFSLLTLDQVRQIHREFTPLELLYVELITQNKEALLAKAKAGRAMKRQPCSSSNGDASAPGLTLSAGTTACVSGFLINMVQRQVRLVSPCPADDRFPLGYMTFAQGDFSTAEDLRRLLLRFIDEQMPASVSAEHPVAFRRGQTCDEIEDGFLLSTPYFHKKFTGASFLRDGARLLLEKCHTAGEIAECLAQRYPVDPAEVFHFLNMLLENGVLDEEPPPPSPTP